MVHNWPPQPGEPHRLTPVSQWGFVHVRTPHRSRTQQSSVRLLGHCTPDRGCSSRRAWRACVGPLASP
jgi:hypothetical protein